MLNQNNMSTKPEKPHESECCGSGCNPCIFDVYEQQLKKWQAKELSSQCSVALNECKFLPFLIITLEIIAPHIRLFEFQPVKLIRESENETLISDAKCDVDYEVLIDNLNLKAGHYLILKGQYKTSDDTGSKIHNVSRSYTPVLGLTNGSTFKIIVALYPDGKMSQFLTDLNVNDIVFWRGPYKEFVYKTNSFQNILLIGGGTGIIPLYNIAKEIVENDAEETLVSFLATFRNVESIILRDELHKMQLYWNFKIDIHITNQGDADYTLKYNENVIFSKINETTIGQELSCSKKEKTFIVICGPPAFNDFIYNIVVQCGVQNENIYVFHYSVYLLLSL